MSKGLDYIINLRDGDFGGADNAKKKIHGLDEAVGHTHEGLGALKEAVGELGKMFLEAFAVEKIIDFGKESLSVYRSTANAEAQITAGIKSTAGAAGLSLDDLREKAEEMEHQTLFSQAQTEQAEAIELTFTNIRGAIFNQAIPAIEDLATRMGGDGPADLKGASVQLGKALQDPMKGIAALHRVGVDFSDAQKEMIATDIKHGQVQKAQAIILAEVNTEFGGSAKAARAVLGPAGDLNEEIEVMKKGLGGLISEGLKVVIPLILDVMHGAKDFFGVLADGYHWIVDNAEMFKTLGIGIAATASAYLIANPAIIAYGIEMGVSAVVTGAMAVATGVLTAAQWALNVALDANPIGLIIVAVGALITGIVIAYEKCETFRAIIAGIGAVGEELMPIFKGLGEIILGAFTFDGKEIAKGFDDATAGVKKLISDGGISGAFIRGANKSLIESERDKKEQEAKDAAGKKGTATDLVPHPLKPDKPFSVGAGGKGKGDGSTTLAGGKSVRNVQVTIGKLVERLEVHTTNLQGVSTADIKRQLTELLTGVVHDSELALGSQ